jgi:hypothetical protein
MEEDKILTILREQGFTQDKEIKIDDKLMFKEIEAQNALYVFS